MNPTLDTYSIVKAFKLAGYNDLEVEAELEMARILVNTTIEQIKEAKEQQQAITLHDLKQIETNFLLELQKLHTFKELMLEKIQSNTLEIQKLRTEMLSEIAAINSHAERNRQEIYANLTTEVAAINSHAERYHKEIYANLATEVATINSHAERNREEARANLATEIAKVHKEIEKVRGELGAEILKSKNSILIWSVSMFAAQTVFIFSFFGKALNIF